MEQQTLHTMTRIRVEHIAAKHDVDFSNKMSTDSIIRCIEAKTGHKGNMNWAAGTPVPWLNEDGTEAPRY